MKRKIIALCLGVTLAFGLADCGNKEEEREASQKQEQASQDEQTESGVAAGQESSAEQEQADPSAEPAQNGTNHAEGRHILIAYFSVPEDVDTSGVDATVSNNTLSFSRGDVADSEEEIRQWAKSLR